MSIINALNQMDCTFYFLMKEKDRTLVLKEEAQKRICKRLEKIADVRFYGMRSGPDIRSTNVLKEEFCGTIPEKIRIILIDREKDEVALLSSEQRDIFFERVMAAEDDIDTVEIAEAVINASM